MTGLFTDRFTAEIHVRVPADEPPSAAARRPARPLPDGRTEFSFDWTKPGFPGTIVAGKFLPPSPRRTLSNIHVFVTENARPKRPTSPTVAGREFEYMTSDFGGAESRLINIVELPDDSVSAAWAPEMRRQPLPTAAAQRLLANTLAHQWWGSEVSPATLNDRVDHQRHVPLRRADVPRRPERQDRLPDRHHRHRGRRARLRHRAAYHARPRRSLLPAVPVHDLEKGAMVFHMLRWEMGDDAFQKFLRAVLSQNTDKGIRSSQVQTIAEAQIHLQLTPFFSQWVDGTGAPAFGNKYSVYRLGNNKGFRTVGSITEDLDLFKMPVELRIETDGKTEERRIDVSGTDSAYTVETFGRPRKVTIDPDNWLLKSTPDLAVRVAVLRGQQDVAQGDSSARSPNTRKPSTQDRGSSLADYRLGEVFFMQRNYQSAANSFRDALRGDDDPRWIEVWSHIHLG